MSRHSIILVYTWCVLCLSGCAQQKGEETTKPFAITLQSGGASVAGVPVRIIDEPSAARAIVTLALREDTKSGPTKALDSFLIEELNQGNGIDAGKTDRNGKISVNHLRGQQFVIAHDGQHLW